MNPSRSTNSTDRGVSITPPKDRPVEATDRAMARRRSNQRVISVVAGIRAEAAKPAPSTV